MKNFKLVDWLVIGALVLALAAAAAVGLALLNRGDDTSFNAQSASMLDALPGDVRAIVESEIAVMDSVKDDDPLIAVIDVWRGDDSWCVVMDQVDVSFTVSYPDSLGAGVFVMDGSPHGCGR